MVKYVKRNAKAFPVLPTVVIALLCFSLTGRGDDTDKLHSFLVDNDLLQTFVSLGRNSSVEFDTGTFWKNLLDRQSEDPFVGKIASQILGKPPPIPKPDLVEVTKLANKTLLERARSREASDDAESREARRAAESESEFKDALRRQELLNALDQTPQAQNNKEQTHGGGEGGGKGRGAKAGSSEAPILPTNPSDDISKNGQQLVDLLNRQQNQNDRSGMLRDVLNSLARNQDTAKPNDKDDPSKKEDGSIFKPGSSSSLSSLLDEVEKEDKKKDKPQLDSSAFADATPPKPPVKTSIPSLAPPPASSSAVPSQATGASDSNASAAKFVGGPGGGYGAGGQAIDTMGSFDLNNLGPSFYPSQPTTEKGKGNYSFPLAVGSANGEGESNFTEDGDVLPESTIEKAPPRGEPTLFVASDLERAKAPGIFGALELTGRRIRLREFLNAKENQGVLPATLKADQKRKDS